MLGYCKKGYIKERHPKTIGENKAGKLKKTDNMH